MADEAVSLNGEEVYLARTAGPSVKAVTRVRKRLATRVAALAMSQL